MTHQFNPTILREYDIRGIVGDTLTEADAYALGRTYAAIARTEAHLRRDRERGSGSLRFWTSDLSAGAGRLHERAALLSPG